MSVGPSGRIVVEVEPELKRELHSALVKDGQTLKEWFVTQAKNYIDGHQQLSLNLTNKMVPNKATPSRKMRNQA